MNKDIIQALQTHVVRNISILIYDYIIPIIQTRSSNNNKVDMDISYSSQKIIVGVGSTIVGQTCFQKSCIQCRGKKSLVLMPGTSSISDRTSIYFHPMSCGQVKNSLIVYVSLTRTSYLITGQVKIFMYLTGGQVKIFRFFYPCNAMRDLTINISTFDTQL